jgi:NTP pyrophosphatase (non-canonical NTP hydrolase)
MELNFPRQRDYQPLLGIMEEVGELAHAHLKNEQGIRRMDPDLAYVKKVDAVGDIIIYLCSYCTASGIDLASAVEKTWAEVEKRDWIAYPQNGVDK